MNWLTRLKNKECAYTHPTKPTKPSSGEVLGGFVGFVGCPPAHIANSLPVSEAANDPATHRLATPPNASPTSSAAYLEARLRLFTRRGLFGTQADALADRLVIRVRDQDERRTCLECSHCTGAAPLSWRCGNHRAAGVGRELGGDLAVMLQRCAGFKEAV